MSPWWISASSETSRVAPPRSGIVNVPVRGPLSEAVSGSVTGCDPTYTRYSAPADISVIVYVTASPGCTGLLGPLGPQPTMFGPVHAHADPVASARAETTLHITRATGFITLPFACARLKKNRRPAEDYRRTPLCQAAYRRRARRAARTALTTTRSRPETAPKHDAVCVTRAR